MTKKKKRMVELPAKLDEIATSAAVTAETVMRAAETLFVKQSDEDQVDMLEQACAELRAEWKPRVLTSKEVRALMEEGREVRKELEARVARMHRIDPRDAERKAR